jgi:cytochrome P450
LQSQRIDVPLRLSYLKVDPENVKFALSTSFDSFEKGEKFHDTFESFWGDGIFTTDGEAWKAHRATARPFFSQDRLSDFTVFDRYIDKMLELIEHAKADGRAIDLQVIHFTFMGFLLLSFSLGPLCSIHARYSYRIFVWYLDGLLKRLHRGG